MLKLKHWMVMGLMSFGLLSACGFQPRGQQHALTSELSPELDKVSFRGLDYYSRFAATLRHTLTAYHIDSIKEARQASAIIHISDLHRGSELLSVDARGKVQEYLYYYRLNFKVLNADGKVLLKPQPLAIERDLLDRGDITLSRRNESDRIFKEMEQKLADLIILRLQTL